MPSKSRKVSFYKITMEEEKTFGNKKQNTFISADKIEEFFSLIYSSKMQPLRNGNKAITVKPSGIIYVIEVVEYNNHRTFLKIGQQNLSNTVALRDSNTLESERVPMKENQLLELFTFALIDFQTGIISYIGINGAPKISAVRALFDDNINSSNKITTNLAAIMTNDILNVLVRKRIISKISLTVAIPEDDILSAQNIDMDTFDSLMNIKSQTATYNIVGRRNKNIFESSSKLAEFVAAIKMKYGNNLKKISANAKDDNEKSQVYDLMQYNFTKTVSLGYDDCGLVFEDDFKEALINTYNTYKSELLRYIRN